MTKVKQENPKHEAVIEAAKEVVIANGKPRKVEALKEAMLALDPEIGAKLS